MNDGNGTLIACRAISNHGREGELPSRVKLLNWGVNRTLLGDVLLDAQSAQSLQDQTTGAFDRVALDFEHNTVPGSEEYIRSQEPRPVAAYGKPEVVSGDGLYLTALEWTDTGKANARNYADLSPAVKRLPDGHITMLHSAALVRNGAVFDLSFYSANQPTKSMPDKPAAAAATSDSKSDVITVADLAKALGMPDNTTKNDLLAFLAKREKEEEQESAHKDDEQADDKGEEDGETTALTAKITKLEGVVTALTAKLDKADQAAEQSTKASILQSFSAQGKAPLGADGKPLNAAALAALPVETLRVLLANTPATVPLTARGRVTEGDSKTLKGRDAVVAAFAKH